MYEVKGKSCDYPSNHAFKIKPENNSIIQSFKQIGAQIKDAVDSQAYLELKKHYCDSKKCLNCRIGNKIIHDVR